jgi:hypothetical protein
LKEEFKGGLKSNSSGIKEKSGLLKEELKGVQKATIGV